MTAPSRVVKTTAIGARVLRQLRGDRRFAIAMILIPVVLLVFLKVVFDALRVPAPAQRRFAVLGTAYVIHFVAFLLTGLVVVRERVGGTLRRMFISGYLRVEVVGGYLGSYTIFATVQGAVVLGVAHYLFELDYALTELAQVFVVLWMLAVLMMSIGILVSTTARTEAQVIPFVPAIVVPALFLSGIVVDVSLLPTWAQALSLVTPMFYATEILQGFLTEGSILADPVALVLLPTFAVAVLALAALTLREEL